MNPNRPKHKALSRFLLTAFTLLIILTDPRSAASQTSASAGNYAALITQADQAFNAKDYGTALIMYNKAAFANTSQQYTSTKIKQINLLLDGDATLKSKLFEDAILKAEDLFGQKNYASAKTEYQKALAIDPSAEFPKDRLSQLQKLYIDPADKSFFDGCMANGDKALTDGDYVKAVQFYETAAAVFPDNVIVKEKIVSARKMQSEATQRAAQAKELVAAADKLLQEGKRPEARAQYAKVLELTPSDAAVKQKIAAIDKVLSDQKNALDNYQKTIEQADQFYISRDFANARIKYQEALKAKPEARYPRDMIEKAKAGESQLQSDQQRYEAAIAAADGLFKSQDFEGAITGYKSAAEIKPAEAYPKSKILEIEKMFADKASKRKAYDDAKAKGDDAFAKSLFAPALEFFKKANSLLPDEQYASAKINEINGLIGKQKAKDEEFKKAVADADKLFAQQQYEPAANAYTKALELKADDVHSLAQLAEAGKRSSALKDTEAKYAGLIKNADNLLENKQYDEALNAYKSALTMKPAEKYPKQRSDEISKILEKQKSDANAYERALSDAAKAFSIADYSNATVLYNQALALRPGEILPQQKIAEIQVITDSLRKIDTEYAEISAQAGKEFDAKQYQDALKHYKQALALKPSEKLPKDRIAAINSQLADLATREENYKNIVLQADNNLISNQLEKSLSDYHRALALKPGEEYPAKQIEKVKELIAQQTKLDADYSAAIADADKLADTKDYANAIAAFNKAQKLKPSENYPANRIKECESAITKIELDQKAYELAIKDAQNEEKAGNLTVAIESYRNALAIRPEEKFVQEKITAIQAILDKNKADDQLYADAVNRGDGYFGHQKYNEALEPYQKAVSLKPGEQYPQQQISKINSLLEEQKRIDENFNRLMTEAASLLDDKNYDQALAKFAEASNLKPKEKLPKDKIAEIEIELARQKKLEDDYALALLSATQAYSNGKLSESIDFYSKALALKPDEKLPAEKIESIKAEIKLKNEQYEQTVAQADQELSVKNYQQAIDSYQKASGFKPEETYPQSKIKEINTLLATQKEELDKMYAGYIADGDRQYSEKSFRDAIASFNNAAGLKPAETYPKQRIDAISKEMKELELARKAEYNKAIGAADNFYNTKVFDQALEGYTAAIAIMPDDPYPGKQIAKIRQYMADHALMDIGGVATIIAEGNEKKYTFAAIEPRLRKNNYILVKANVAAGVVPKVYLNYGRDNQKNGGIVLRNLNPGGSNDLMIRISVQDRWYRDDNNWISLFVETGSLEVTKVQIAAGD